MNKNYLTRGLKYTAIAAATGVALYASSLPIRGLSRLEESAEQAESHIQTPKVSYSLLESYLESTIKDQVKEAKRNGNGFTMGFPSEKEIERVGNLFKVLRILGGKPKQPERSGPLYITPKTDREYTNNIEIDNVEKTAPKERKPFLEFSDSFSSIWKDHKLIEGPMTVPHPDSIEEAARKDAESRD